jgi:hypothetical protein
LSFGPSPDGYGDLAKWEAAHASSRIYWLTVVVFATSASHASAADAQKQRTERGAFSGIFPTVPTNPDKAAKKVVNPNQPKIPSRTAAKTGGGGRRY